MCIYDDQINQKKSSSKIGIHKNSLKNVFI